jgi:oxygen-independent coproporphyrinogen-3 oxidase
MYGLPHQTVADVVRTVDLAARLVPDRLALFGYAHVPWMKKHQRLIDEAALPGGAERFAQAAAAAARLAAHGYRRIGLDHFARPGDAMAVAGGAGSLHRNFQGYTTDPADTLIGFGASAIGRLPHGYVQNAAVTRDYLAAIGTGRLATVKGFALSGDDRLRADLIERLMCDFRVDMDDVCRRHGMARAVLADALPDLDRLAAEGVIHRDGGRIELAADALALVRAVAAAFDAYRTGGAGRTHALAL